MALRRLVPFRGVGRDSESAVKRETEKNLLTRTAAKVREKSAHGNGMAMVVRASRHAIKIALKNRTGHCVLRPLSYGRHWAGDGSAHSLRDDWAKWRVAKAEGEAGRPREIPAPRCLERQKGLLRIIARGSTPETSWASPIPWPCASRERNCQKQTWDRRPCGLSCFVQKPALLLREDPHFHGCMQRRDGSGKVAFRYRAQKKKRRAPAGVEPGVRWR